jgi:hypothetical protein
MADYLVVPDDYAGWNPTGRYFALAGVAAGSIGLLSWLSLHGRLGSFQPSAAADQVFLSGLAWLGIGGFWSMAILTFGSILLTLKSRGTVSVTGEGVYRAVGSRSQSLAWSDIEGLVAMPYGGVTLVSTPGKSNIIIPRFLDDYRAFIAEIKDHSVQTLPASSLRQKQNIWKDRLRNFVFLFFYLIALNDRESHRARIAGLIGSIAFMVWLVRDDWSKSLTLPRWFMVIPLLGFILYALRRMAISW